MTVIQSPDQREELKHVDEILLQELQRVDEILLQELERVDEVLLRIVAAIDQLPERIAAASKRGQLGSMSGNGNRAAEPQGSRASTRPFNPYDEDEAVAVEVKKSAARQVASKVRSWLAAYARIGRRLDSRPSRWRSPCCYSHRSSRLDRCCRAVVREKAQPPRLRAIPLLRQPGGFEGCFDLSDAKAEDLSPDQLPIAKGVGDEERLLQLPIASRHTP